MQHVHYDVFCFNIYIFEIKPTLEGLQPFNGTHLCNLSNYLFELEITLGGLWLYTHGPNNLKSTSKKGCQL